MSDRTKNSSKKERPVRQTDERAVEAKSFAGKFTQISVLLGVVSFLFMTAALAGFDPDAPGAGDGQNWIGRFGSAIAYYLSVASFGRWGAFSLPVAIGIALAYAFGAKRMSRPKWITASLLAGYYIGFGSALYTHLQDGSQDIARSGIIPLRVMEISLYYLYSFGTIVLACAVLLAFAILLFSFPLLESLALLFYRIPNGIYNGVASLWRGRREEEEEKSFDDEDEMAEDEEEYDARRREEPAPKRQPAPQTLRKPAPTPTGALKAASGPRAFPPLGLLDPPPPVRTTVTQAELEENARRLEEKLASLGVTARVIRTNPGPVITRYDLEPSADVKVSRIASLSDDIAMALRARGIRILAPIPGEAAVGVEIPNRTQETVYIRDVIGSEEFRTAKAPLTMALGKDASGRIFVADLAKTPHLLIAGSTGSGKSVCINTLLLSLLFRSDPADVRVVLVDPKKLELSLYARLADQHLIAPRGLGENVITTPENAVLALQSVHAEMSRRYDTLAAAGVRNLDEYNRWLERNPWEGEGPDLRRKLPYIVVVIDELADLMMTVRREFEDLVVRLAQMSRAVGIHLVVATQRPSVDVVTGLIKSNFPSRIAFQVAAGPDSRTIIDGYGAEALLGRGDMLFMGIGSGAIVRAHGALSSTEDVERVVEFIAAQPPVDPTYQLPDPETMKVRPAGGEGADLTGADELFDEAARIVVKVEQGSVSILQRRLRVGYSRAARLIDQLEQAGIVGSFDGSKARQVLVGPDELKSRYGIEL